MVTGFNRAGGGCPKSTGKASEMINDTATKAIAAIFERLLSSEIAAIFERLLSSDFFVSDIGVFIFSLDECGGTPRARSPSPQYQGSVPVGL